MKFTRILGVAAALAAASVVAQEAATVTPAPETAPAPVTTLEADNTPATWGDAKAGATKAAACAACHGADGNAADPQYPKLAGQHERYIARQLALFKSGERENAIMMGFAAPLSAQDMRDIGAYFATQKVVAGVADESLVAEGPNQGRKFFEVGERLFRAGKADHSVPACQACHGPTGTGNPGPAWPALGGQHASYTATALTAFRDGKVWGKDANANAIMAAVAANLSDEEIQGLATYIEGLHNVADAPTAEALAAAAAAPAPAAAPAAAPADAAATDAAPADAEATPAPAAEDGATPPQG
ncbi:c-type cytochrome [Arenimonas sp. MALMAid1274]|uniref:c-type cytochrome n=1 Tax=Arenimonas sp. MALMAid1274 TaxID=3411630 RepID=UPI003B9F2281